MQRRMWGLVVIFWLVSLGPSWALTENFELTLHSGATSAVPGKALNVVGYNTVIVEPEISGAATVDFKVSGPGITGWVSRPCSLVSSATAAAVTQATATGVYSCDVSGMTAFLAQISSYTSGTVTVKARATTGGGGGGSSSGTVYVSGSAIGCNSTDEDGSVATGALGDCTSISKTYAYNSDSGVLDWGRLSLQPADYDTGGGTENVSMIGIALPASGGPAAVSSTNPMPVVFPGTLVSGAVTTAMTGTTSTSVVSGTASNYLYITNCVVSNASTTVSTDIILQDGNGGTTLYNLPAPAASVATTGGGGSVVSFPVPLKVPTSGNALYAANVTTGSSTKISCSGYRSTASY